MKMRGNNLDLGNLSGSSTKFILPAEARAMHLYVAGGTGVGKSKSLEHLIRQDILNWRTSRSGLLLLDPHGSLYDNILAWVAKYKLNRPIIPIDLRRNDWIASYNLLRKRKTANPSVVIDSIVDAMAHVWGQSGTDHTPLFARWAGNILTALYEKGRTLSDAIPLLDDPSIRRAITANLKDPQSRRDWKLAAEMKRSEFENQIGSTINRLPRFVRNENFEAMFGQSDVSLDLSQALDEGHIILVSLAREGAKVSQENTRLFGTLLLNDLWTAAQERGKPRDARDIKPFYVYLDEFQRFITPTIAENLDEARGFGLHLTIAHQFPKQLRDEGDNGRKLYNSVMENTATKVVFRLTDRENLQPLAEWLYTGVMNPDEVKHELYSTKVMSYREEERQSHTVSSSSTSGGGTGGGSGSSATYHDTGLEYEELSVADSDSSSFSDSWSATESESTTTTTVLVPELGKELSQVQFRSLEEQLHFSMKALFDQKQRHCVVRIADRMKAPVTLVTPNVDSAFVSPARIERYLNEAYKRWPFFLPMSEATKKLVQWKKSLIAEFSLERFVDEPVTARRKV